MSWCILITRNVFQDDDKGKTSFMDVFIEKIVCKKHESMKLSINFSDFMSRKI